MLQGELKRALRVIVRAMACAVGMGAWLAPPAQASDAVTWGLQRVEQNKQVLNKAEKHLKWATRHHYHVAGLHRWLRKHVVKQQTLRAMGVHFRSDRVLRHLERRMARTQWKVDHWPKVRARLHRKVEHKRAKVIGMEQWVQGVIRAQAAYQARRADAILKGIAKDKADPGKAITGDTLGVKAVRAALTQLGVPYVWGGETAGKAFDCSGLVKWAYGQVGVSLVHFAATQATEGETVALADLQPGDLVFFEQPIGHVAMYVGGGLLIEAPNTGDVVKLTRLDDSWHVANFQTAVRPG